MIQRRRILPPDYDETLTDPQAWSNRTKKYPVPDSYKVLELLAALDDVLPVDTKTKTCIVVENAVDKYKQLSLKSTKRKQSKMNKKAKKGDKKEKKKTEGSKEKMQKKTGEKKRG